MLALLRKRSSGPSCPASRRLPAVRAPKRTVLRFERFGAGSARPSSRRRRSTPLTTCSARCFTRLASRLRESGQVVYGFGERKTPKPFVAACDKFTYVDILKGPQADGKSDTKGDAQKLKGDAELMNLLRSAIEESDDEDGWSNLSLVGKQISSQKPDFDPRHYGFSKLSSLIKAIDLFEFRPEVPGQSGIYVRSTKAQRSGRRR